MSSIKLRGFSFSTRILRPGLLPGVPRLRELLPIALKTPKSLLRKVELEIDVMREADFEQTMWMNARLMTQHESVMRMYGITPEMQYESMAMHREFYVESGHTLVIRESGKVIGAIIGESLWNEDEGVASTGVDVGRYLSIHELSRGHWLNVA